MNIKNYLCVLLAFATGIASASSTVDLKFGARYTTANFFSPSTITLPLDTQLSFSFSLAPSVLLATSNNTTRMSLKAPSEVLVADSPVFALLPQPQISWFAGPTGSDVWIEKNNITSEFRLGLASSLSYSEGCVLKCTNYFKSVSVVSDYFHVGGYDPFVSPLEFILSLQSSKVTFDSNVIQDSWQRFGSRDYYQGSNLGTVLGRTSDGSLFRNGGGAWLKSVTAPVPEQDEYAMMLVGLGLLGLVTRRQYKK